MFNTLPRQLKILKLIGLQILNKLHFHCLNKPMINMLFYRLSDKYLKNPLFKDDFEQIMNKYS